MSDYGASDYYIAQIQRLEADRNFWQAAATADERKIAQLEADLRKARAELEAMNKWQQMVEVEIHGTKLYAQVDSVGEIEAVYCEPMQDLSGIISERDYNHIIGQVEDGENNDA